MMMNDGFRLERPFQNMADVCVFLKNILFILSLRAVGCLKQGRLEDLFFAKLS